MRVVPVTVIHDFIIPCEEPLNVECLFFKDMESPLIDLWMM